LIPRLRDHHDEPWRLAALEINLRVVGTTHPFLALRFLTGGEMDPESGHFISIGGRPKFYRRPTTCARALRSLVPETSSTSPPCTAAYSHRTESGVLFHMIGRCPSTASSASR